MARYRFVDPWSGGGLSTLEQLRRGMDELAAQWGSPPLRQQGAFPPVNIYETGGGYVLTAELPGLPGDAIDVRVERNRVTLSGERSIHYPEDAGRHRLERQAGYFRRTVELPVDVDADRAEAVHRNGVLELRIPKAPEHQPRRVAINA